MWKRVLRTCCRPSNFKVTWGASFKTTTLTDSLSLSLCTGTLRERKRERGMGSSNHASALVVCALALSMACTAVAQNTQQDVVDVHNSARAAVGVGPVSWDDDIASYAQKFANKRVTDCQLVHSGGPYGENLFWGTGRAFTLTEAVNVWIAEKQYYDYENNSCADGQVCGHYTQVVWQNTTAIGCAWTQCSDGTGIFIVCDYSPAGNFVGQRPYEVKAQENNVLSLIVLFESSSVLGVRQL
nr:pathogenesis-related protein 1 [Musa acuminata]